MSLVNSVLNYLEEKFGIDRKVFDNYALVEDRDIWVTSKEAASFKMKFWRRKGIRLVRVFKKSYKLTTSGMQIFGKYATKNIVQLKEEHLERFLQGENVKVGEIDGVEEGQVIVKYKSDVIGSAIYRNGMLKNQLPKGRRIH